MPQADLASGQPTYASSNLDTLCTLISQNYVIDILGLPSAWNPTVHQPRFENPFVQKQGGGGGQPGGEGVAGATTSNVCPVLKNLMQPYYAKYDKLHLNNMLKGVNMKQSELPYLHGVKFLCYSYILGRCAKYYCSMAHINWRDHTPGFFPALATTLAPAVKAFVNKEGGGRKQKQNQV